MAAISDIYIWCSVVPCSFAGFPVKRGPDTNRVIVTNGQHVICVVQVADQQTIKSWSAKQLFSFTCSAIFNPIKKVYCVVQNDHLLRQWTDDSETLMNSQKTKFTEKIYSILDFDCLEPVIVFSKGDCQVITKAIETKKDKKCDYILEDDICWAGGCYDDMSYYIMLITMKKQGSEKTLHLLRLLKSAGIVDNHKCQPLHKDEASPLSWCLQQGRERAPLYVLWSDGELLRYDYESLSFKKMLNFSFVTQNSSVTTCCLNNSYIAVVSVPKNREFSDPSLEIWDVNFSTMKERKVLSFLTEGVQVDFISGVLFVLNNKELKGIYCNLLPSSLASVVGSTKPSTQGNDENRELIVKWTSQEMDNGIEEVNIECKKLQDLLQMESSGQTLPCLWKELFSDLHQKSDITTLENALEQWKHVPEEVLAKIMAFCLSARNEIFADITSEPMDMDDDCPFSHHKALFLNKLLCLPFNDMFIHKHLQSIPFHDIMSLLQYLLYILKSEKESQPLDRRPSIQMISSWLCILFDAHFNNFILSKDGKVHRLSLDLQDAIKTMLALYRDLDNLEELLIFAQEKFCHSTQSRPPTAYCIEILCI